MAAALTTFERWIPERPPGSLPFPVDSPSCVPEVCPAFELPLPAARRAGATLPAPSTDSGAMGLSLLQQFSEKGH